MDAALLDTAYVYALLNTRDQWHTRARQWEQSLISTLRPLITTDLVLVEIADGLANLRFRMQAIVVLDALQTGVLIEIVPASTDLLDQAFSLYRQRGDKEWGLTDCASFVVMQQRSLHEALTSDEHFAQAGFRPLLREEPPV